MTLNLSQPWDEHSNMTRYLFQDPIMKSQGEATPYFVDGAMLYNDAELFLYGGAMFRNDELYASPPMDDVPLYQAYQYGEEKPLWRPTVVHRKLGRKVNRYVAYGGAASAPSEKKAWYFSGLVSPGHGEIFTVSDSERTTLAHRVSDTLITVDMKTQNNEVWRNDTLPPGVKGRANPEVVWVPVGEQGILVVLGGVLFPEWAGTKKSHQSDDPEASVGGNTCGMDRRLTSGRRESVPASCR